MPYEAYRDAMRLFLSATMFQIPNFDIAESSGPHTYLYHFEEPSPYLGPTFGIPCHGQYALFMYNNESYQYSDPAGSAAVEWLVFRRRLRVVKSLGNLTLSRTALCALVLLERP
jgi:hypothetical protein